MKQRPNIILILADDMGYGDFATFNEGLTRTPNLDNMIKEGICFTQHYSASPVCNPARASLMTGRYPHRTGSIEMREWHGYERLALREITIADILKKHGYATGLIGKWHLGSFDMRYHPMNRGFDETVCFRGGTQDYYSWRLEYNEKVVRSDGTYLTDVFTDESVDFIKRHKNEPFFLHLAYNAPHVPLQVPAAEAKPFLESGKFNWGVSMLYGMIQRMDRGIGKILETLKKLDLEENTIVMFASDNGPQFGGEGDNCIDRFNCGYKGSKFFVYEGGIRVPMIIRWPENLKEGAHIDDMVHFNDWLPTILSMTGSKIPEELNIDGLDLSPLIRGEKGKVDIRRFWQWNWEVPNRNFNAAARDGDWKLVRPTAGRMTSVLGPRIEPWKTVALYSPEFFIHNGLIENTDPIEIPEKIPEPELYNISDDYLETNDLANKYPERVRKMSAELDGWFEDIEADRQSIDDKR